MNMDYDKRNGNVVFYEDSHKYVDLDTNNPYISVTTLIEKFGQPFDKEFWSAYKALEKILSKEEFKMEKKNLLDTKKIELKYLMDMYNFSEDSFNKEQQNILDEWQKTNIESCARGTKIHSDLEQSFTKKKETDLKKFGLGGKFQVNTNDSLIKSNTNLLDIDKGVFPEYLVYFNTPDEEFKLAGQIDLLIKDGNDIYIADYKTNKKIDEKSFFDSKTKKNEMMQYPLNNLMDCNKIHYTLQLSTYAYMLQKLNPKFNIKKLTIIHYDHDGKVTEYDVDYLREDVIRMCRWYKKQKKLQDIKDSRKPIIF